MIYVFGDYARERIKVYRTDFFIGDIIQDKKYRTFKILDIRNKSVILERESGKRVATDHKGFRDLIPRKKK